MDNDHSNNDIRIDTDGGASVGNDVITEGGDFVGRDQYIAGDLVSGNKIVSTINM